MAERTAFAARLAARDLGKAPTGLMLANHEQSVFERPALRGFATTYGQPFERDGLVAFLPGCFAASLAADVVNVQIDHIGSTSVGDTRAGLRFVDHADGLAFEFELPPTQGGAVMAAMIASNGRTDVSVGVDVLASTEKELRGHKVRLVTKAKLREISVCKAGAVRHASVRLIDLAATSLTLEDELRLGTLGMVARLNEAVTGIKDSVNRLDAAVRSHTATPAVNADASEWSKQMHVLHLNDT
ncbi:HK97 family phage prohead protease [Mesorhizobium sp. M1148]|uniref:HK97 family phage prohead protease n=1 Tax=unclassified Mesorhizobium TaxID=325217 RepID=UPI00333B572F